MRKEELAEKNCPFFGHGEEMNDLGHCWNKNGEPCIQQCNGLLADGKTTCAFMEMRMKREINTYIEVISVQSDNVGSSDFKLWVPFDGAICAVDMMENRMTKAAIEAFCSSNHSSLCILNRTTNFSCRESCKYINEFVGSLIETEQQPTQIIRHLDKEECTILKEFVSKKEEILRIRFLRNPEGRLVATQIQIENADSNTVSWITLDNDQTAQLYHCIGSNSDADIERISTFDNSNPEQP